MVRYCQTADCSSRNVVYRNCRHTVVPCTTRTAPDRSAVWTVSPREDGSAARTHVAWQARPPASSHHQHQQQQQQWRQQQRLLRDLERVAASFQHVFPARRRHRSSLPCAARARAAGARERHTATTRVVRDIETPPPPPPSSRRRVEPGRALLTAAR